mmetsp:Transcript_73539/g.198160  ORF Transcript_73539/g.198160 Transcript_73539/m.198160 type:complete len:215 (-) Transcript_73539:1132-1776(-)
MRYKITPAMTEASLGAPRARQAPLNSTASARASATGRSPRSWPARRPRWTPGTSSSDCAAGRRCPRPSRTNCPRSRCPQDCRCRHRPRPPNQSTAPAPAPAAQAAAQVLFFCSFSMRSSRNFVHHRSSQVIGMALASMAQPRQRMKNPAACVYVNASHLRSSSDTHKAAVVISSIIARKSEESIFVREMPRYWLTEAVKKNRTADTRSNGECPS